ncbi:uroporphyrin-III C-methyltransferase/precorrin-2 dehydrogenase/sirohydrochlorin ferrochelatase [Kineosporia succinea]|uniref:Uroporphyrin-III C-methyltransferase/precorrin-2 dehydrogenase/sirohydrochlorin ferrochelatase n=1 Tax=Kineosporia succinea TaxID=84632 RepID=A0ABT9NZ82_9ACTN|nr:uroporphyrinogen-III C-methyltransferase [Kineosporia succinea]MDP9825125.1 uroporphyrin-III C-methyltransferase/precorrin-2 dehydrogenase/sirohydrochlorin ferrochelatase [Kineosporia succinea]
MDRPYIAGLDLTGRRVVVVGGGTIAQRRLPALLDVGARIELIAPAVTPAIEGMAGADEIVWVQRRYEPGDLAGAWYAMAVTDDPTVNAAVAQEAEEQRVFCVRADRAAGGSASTPASGEWHGLRIAVASESVGPGSAHGADPLRAAVVRDSLLEWLRSGAGDRILAERKQDTRAQKTQNPKLPGVALVGGGPGDPDLITVRGRRLLGQADVVVVDRLGPRSLLPELSPDVELIDATKLPRGRSMSQEAINAALVEHALAGKFVVRLKGGDPYVFGRGSEELEACLDAGVPVQVVPGLSSAISVPGLAGIPLTHRGVAHEAVIVSGHLPPDNPDSLIDWTALAKLHGTIVVLMGVANLPAIARTLVEHGRDPLTGVAVIQDGSMPAERVTVSDLAGIGEVAERENIRPPAIIVIGDVVGRRPKEPGNG